jgi:hypothetical protein
MSKIFGHRTVKDNLLAMSLFSARPFGQAVEFIVHTIVYRIFTFVKSLNNFCTNRKTIYVKLQTFYAC